MACPGRLHRGAVVLEEGDASSCAGLPGEGGKGCARGAGVTLQKGKILADPRNLQKVGPPCTAPAVASLQRRPMTSATAGGQNSSTEDVLGVAQKRRAEGPTAVRNLINQGSANEDIVATEEGDAQGRDSRSTEDRR